VSEHSFTIYVCHCGVLGDKEHLKRSMCSDRKPVTGGGGVINCGARIQAVEVVSVVARKERPE
jgi:hypothetical protein